MYTLLLAFFISLTVVNGQRVAVANLVSGNVVGSVKFTETDQGLHVAGNITGLEPGLYGFHIHESGDISTCANTGTHFNPDGNNHAGRENATRHIGDLGNVEFVGNGTDAVAVIDFIDGLISLHGRNSILGRALVLHETSDDLGLGGDEGSITTGNAGGRVACGVIGISSPIDPWDSGNGSNSIGLFGFMPLLTLIGLSKHLFSFA